MQVILLLWSKRLRDTLFEEHTQNSEQIKNKRRQCYPSKHVIPLYVHISNRNSMVFPLRFGDLTNAIAPITIQVVWAKTVRLHWVHFSYWFGASGWFVLLIKSKYSLEQVYSFTSFRMHKRKMLTEFACRLNCISLLDWANEWKWRKNYHNLACKRCLAWCCVCVQPIQTKQTNK